MFSKSAGSSAGVPSRNALRVLRQLALAGSTVGSICTIATITYDVHRRVRIAERIIENKRTIQSSAPNYDATSAARRLARMIEAAEAGEFMGLDSLKDDDRKLRKRRDSQVASASPAQDEQAVPKDGSENAPVKSETKVPPVWLLQTQSQDRFPAPVKNLWGARKPNDSQEHRETEGTDSPSAEQERPATPLSRVDSGIGLAQDERLSENTTKEAIPDENVFYAPDRIRDLLDRDRPIEAAQLFLDTHPASLKGLPSDRRELALEIFLVNCREGNVFIAKSIFERIEAVDKVNLTMWKALLFALAQKGHVESVATLYLRYRHQFHVPPYLVDIILRALLESHRLTTAKWFLFRNLKLDQNCGLSGLYLSGLWKKTRSIELLNGQFQKLLKFLRRLGKRPTEKLFNPMLKAYVEFGRVADAEALATLMETKYEIPPSCRSKGLLVYAQALRCEWEKVERGLQEMHDLGLTENRHDFTRIFDRIFLEYWVVNPGSAIRDFVFRSIERYNLVPDAVLYKHILEAFVEKGDQDMIAELSHLARERNWKIPIDEKEFLEILRTRRHAVEQSPVGFWNMLQAARIKYGQSATSQQILGYDRTSFPLVEVNQMPYSDYSVAWYERTMKQMLPSRPVDQYQSLDKQMSYYMHVGKMDEALRCFRNAKEAKLVLKQRHVELAVAATLIKDGLAAARAVVEEEWRELRRKVQFFPLFFRQVMEAEPADEGEVLKMAVFHFYNLCWENPKLIVKHHITVATSRRLMVDQKPEVALDLLKDVYMSRYGRTRKFDGTCMKMFVRAFEQTGNVAGVRWCILTALSRGTALNRDLVVEVRRALASLRWNQKGQHSEHYLAYLDYLAGLLEQKSNGVPELRHLRTNRGEKRLARKTSEEPRVVDELRSDFASVRLVVEHWDEERELEQLFGGGDTDPRETARRWSERQVLTAGNLDDLDEKDCLEMMPPAQESLTM